MLGSVLTFVYVCVGCLWWEKKRDLDLQLKDSKVMFQSYINCFGLFIEFEWIHMHPIHLEFMWVHMQVRVDDELWEFMKDVEGDMATTTQYNVFFWNQ